MSAEPLLSLPVVLADVAESWPVEVGAAVINGAEQLLDRYVAPAATTLDLGVLANRAKVIALATDMAKPPHLRSVATVDSFTTVVSWGGLAAVPDLVGFLRAVRQLLLPQGSLLFSETVGRPGLRRVVQASFEARRPEFHDLHLGRDLNAALREADFVIDQVHRTRVASAPLLLRYVAYGRACLVPFPSPAP